MIKIQDLHKISHNNPFFKLLSTLYSISFFILLCAETNRFASQSNLINLKHSLLFYPFLPSPLHHMQFIHNCVVSIAICTACCAAIPPLWLCDVCGVVLSKVKGNIHMHIQCIMIVIVGAILIRMTNCLIIYACVIVWFRASMVFACRLVNVREDMRVYNLWIAIVDGNGDFPNKCPWRLPIFSKHGSSVFPIKSVRERPFPVVRRLGSA